MDCRASTDSSDRSDFTRAWDGPTQTSTGSSLLTGARQSGWNQAMYKVASYTGLLASVAAVLLAGTPPAFAIPSPELVVGSLSSLSQVASLVFAMLGGGAALVGTRVAANRVGAKGRSRFLWPFAIGVFVCFAASLWINIYQYTSNIAARQDRLEETLIRPTPLGPDGKPLDDLIREPAWEEQLTDPHGMSTAEVEKFMNEYNR